MKKIKMEFKYVVFCIFTVVLFAFVSIYGIIDHVDSFAEGRIIDVRSAPSSDAIMVLGAYVSPEGKPSMALSARLDYGYELYAANKAPKILASGDHGTAGYDEVSGMRDYLLDLGVPRGDIFLDHAGFNTYDSMYRAKEIFHVETLLISTQEFHINRSIYIARSLGIDAYGYPCPDKEEYNMNRLNFREALAKIKAYFDTEIIKRKSKYLGKAIPISGNGIVTEG